MGRGRGSHIPNLPPLISWKIWGCCSGSLAAAGWEIDYQILCLVSTGTTSIGRRYLPWPACCHQLATEDGTAHSASGGSQVVDSSWCLTSIELITKRFCLCICSFPYPSARENRLFFVLSMPIGGSGLKVS